MNTPNLSLATQDGRDVVRGLLTDLIEGGRHDDVTVERYVSPDYVQHVDGKTLNFEQFKAHLRTLHGVCAQMRVYYHAIVQEGDTVFTHHEVAVTKRDGRTLRAQVIAHFTLRDGRVVVCTELTRLLEGNHEDQDLGSRV